MLHKISAEHVEITTHQGKALVFNRVELDVSSCVPHLSKPDMAWVSVWENTGFDHRQNIFSGWLVAENTAVSSMEHAIYDIKLLGCVQHSSV